MKRERLEDQATMAGFLPTAPFTSRLDDPSLCESCQNMREVSTARSRFLLCQLSATNSAFRKYPPQPVVRCNGYQSCNEAEQPKLRDAT